MAKVKKSEKKKNKSRNDSKKLKYVIHEHHASHLHFDLRLEHRGVLKSWAVPKRPSTNPGVRRLAVQVANHSIEYAGFCGTIPKGAYGAGKVLIWDRGWHRPVQGEWTKNKIVTEIHGRKLKGRYCLVRFARSGPKNWLFFRMAK